MGWPLMVPPTAVARHTSAITRALPMQTLITTARRLLAGLAPFQLPAAAPLSLTAPAPRWASSIIAQAREWVRWELASRLLAEAPLQIAGRFTTKVVFR